VDARSIGRDGAPARCTSIAVAMRRRAWQKRKRLLLAAVTAATIALGLLAYATGLLYPLEAQSVDARFSIRGTDRRWSRTS
jgi:CHASE2 domain-containing sensor protein